MPHALNGTSRVQDFLLQRKSGPTAIRNVRLARTHHIPQAPHAKIAPGTIDFAFLIQAPDRLTFLNKLIATDTPDVCMAVAQPIRFSYNSVDEKG
jgi:hypothetical protein